MTQSCDLCGRPDARFRARVAGTEATVCERCASMGEIIEQVREPPKKSEIKRIERQKRATVRDTDRIEEVVDDIGEKIRHEREELDWKQEELAKKVSEHESMIKRIEHGYIPSLKIAHKLEKVLHIKLTEYVKPTDQEYVSGSSGGSMTLGDMVKIKREKKGQI